MISKLIKILSEIDNISGYKIIETKVDSGELFFVRKNLDMNRAKSVHNFSVTVYNDFIDNEIKYRGSSSTIIHPTLSDEEIVYKLKDASLAAGFVKNKYYPLAKPSNLATSNVENNHSNPLIETILPKISEAIYKADTFDKGFVNSSEIFLNKNYTRILTSEGIDVSYENYKGEVEFITDWKENNVNVELYRRFNFSELECDSITEMVYEQLKISQEKALATKTPALNRFTVLLTGSPVEEIFNFYYIQAGAQNVYNHISNAEIGKNLQGDHSKGDLVTITLDPALYNSTFSVPYDIDGFALKPIKIFENGVLMNYWGDIRHSYYLKVEPTGVIKNLVIEGGLHSIDEFKKEPYLELVAFSDFQMNAITGDFGGEIRLGWYFDGKETKAITGGSISGNIHEAQKHMYLSKELQKNNGFYGPKTIKFENISIAGIE